MMRRTLDWLTRLDNRVLGPPRYLPRQEWCEVRAYRLLAGGVFAIAVAVFSWCVVSRGPMPIAFTALGLLYIGLGIQGLAWRRRHGRSLRPGGYRAS